MIPRTACLLALLLPLLAPGEGKPVTYTHADKDYEGYYVSPPFPAGLVLLLHDWDGLTDYEVKRAAMLAESGYAVFAADLFGKGIRPTEVTDRRQHTGELYTDRAKMRALVQAALDAAKAEGAPTTNAVVMGYCFGGAAALEFARSGTDHKGFVSFHGGLATPAGQDYAQSKGQVLVLHGGADTAISLDEFATLAKELEAHKVAHELISYGGAPHAFTVFGGERYREDADRKSWKRFLDFLEETLR